MKNNITEEHIWKIIFHKDFYKILGDNMWKRHHNDVHNYMIKFLDNIFSAKNLKEQKEIYRNLKIFRDKSKITNIETWEKEIYEKYKQRFN